jgi:hypothetical protein
MSRNVIVIHKISLSLLFLIFFFSSIAQKTSFSKSPTNSNPKLAYKLFKNQRIITAIPFTQTGNYL